MAKKGNKESIKITHDFDEFSAFLDQVEEEERSPSPGVETQPSPTYVTRFGEKVTFVHPQYGNAVSVEFLKALSVEVLDYANAKSLENRDVAQFQPLVALPGDILVHVQKNKTVQSDFAGEETNCHVLEAGPHVLFDGERQYVADQYGFVILENNSLSICSPLKISHDMLRVDWLFTAEHPVGVARPMIEFWLADARVKNRAESGLDGLLEACNGGDLSAEAYSIVTGTPPVQGVDGKIEWHVNVDHIAGKILPDGRIDFRERNFVVNVTDGQLLATVRHAVKGKPGKDIYGRLLQPEHGVSVHLAAGENVRREKNDTETLFYSALDGAVHHFQDKLEVTNVLTLPDGVNFETGNIDFSGDIIVYGGVRSGFTVQAGGDIIVTEDVENGAILEARGNIVVGTSISGKRTKVVSGLCVKAQFVNEATVRAKTDILLGSYAWHAKLRALGEIKVNRSTDITGGAIIGGEAWATQRIDVHVAGADAWIQTELIAGILPEQTEKLEQLKKSIEAKNIHIRQILDFFELSSIDLNKLKRIIEQAEGIVRKRMAIRAKYLAKSGKELQQLIAEKSRLIDEIGPAPDNAEICIREKAYPNVLFCIGPSRRNQERTIGPTLFKLQNEKLVQLSFASSTN